jgi:hypothetical protein
VQETDRRTLLASGAGLTALLATGAMAQTEVSSASAGMEPGTMEIIHIYADAEGISHFRRVKAEGMPKPLPVAGVFINAMEPQVEDWHPVNGKLFTLNTFGDIVGEMGDGTTVSIGKGDLVFLEDSVGKGHITRMLTPVAAVFLSMRPDFDFEEWLKPVPIITDMPVG